MHLRFHQLRIAFLALTLVLTGFVADVASAQTGPALMVIRFNQSRVYFDQQLYGAISKAIAIKPDLMFDVVSYAPSTGNPTTDRQWQAVAGRNTRSVIDAMTGMGVPMQRINVIGESQSGLRYDETHVFVR